MVIALNDVDLKLATSRGEESALLDAQLSMSSGKKRQVQLECEEGQSRRTFSTPGPNSSLSVAMMRVFFPAPDGP